jgi:hypothetical protein
MGCVVNATPLPLYPRERTGTHCTRGWMEPGAGLGGCGKCRSHQNSIPRPFKPVASRYTNYAFSAYNTFDAPQL